MTAAPNNYEITCADQFKTDLDALTRAPGSGSTDVKLFVDGVAIIPGSHLEQWASAVPSNRKPWGALIIGTPFREDIGGGGDSEYTPLSRADVERMEFGFAVILQADRARDGNYRDAVADLIDASNRVKNQIAASSLTLHTAGTVAATGVDYLEWSDEIDRPDAITSEYLFRGYRFTLGVHYTTTQTR